MEMGVLMPLGTNKQEMPELLPEHTHHTEEVRTHRDVHTRGRRLQSPE